MKQVVTFLLTQHPEAATKFYRDTLELAFRGDDGFALVFDMNGIQLRIAKVPSFEAAKHTVAKVIVIAGHIHAYQRFERNGVVYLVSGGGGAAQHLIARTPNDLYQDNVFPNFHYVKFESVKGALKATMYRLDAQGSFVSGDSFLVQGAK